VSERKHPLARCEDCPLNEIGVYVPTAFPKDTPNGIAVVGEAPGFQEATYGVPFKGPSGQLLNKVLAHHGIDRSGTLLTNACLCRPPDNATPSKEAIAACRPRLMDDLSGVEKVLTLGTPAAQSVLYTKKGVLSLRPGPAREKDGRKVVCTVHPAYVMRQGDAFPSLVNDTAKLVLDPPVWNPPQFVVVDTEEEALQAIEQLDVITDKLVVDIECGIDKDNSFDHPNHYQMLCVGVAYAKGKVCVFGENSLTELVWEALKGLFSRKKLIAQNGKFDLAGLYPKLGALKLWFDTMLAHYCTDERPGFHSLGMMGMEILGTPDWKGEIEKYLGPDKNYAAVPRPILYRYNAYDDAVTWDLYEYFEAELEKRGLRKLHDFLVAASNELMFLELNGITIDRAYNRKLTVEYLAKLDEMEEGLNQFLGVDEDGEPRNYDKRGGINPRSPQQVKLYLQHNKIPAKGTDKEILKYWLGRTNPDSDVHKFIAGLLEHRSEAKKYGTYVKGITKRLYRGRVFTNYLLHGTTSGRLASRNPNLQNIIRDNSIKAQFVVSKPGNIFIHADYKQAEGRVICTEARDEYLRELFSDPDRSIFADISEKLYGSREMDKEQKIRVKAFFYGISYGREAYSIAQEFKMPVDQVEEDLRKFRELIPATVEWQRKTVQQILTKQVLTTSFGRHRRFWLITKENKKDVINEGLSFVPQSTASDICLSALIKLRPMLRDLGFIRLTIHDALVVECPERHVEEATVLMRETMVAEAARWTDYVPFAVDITTGKNWGEL